MYPSTRNGHIPLSLLCAAIGFHKGGKIGKRLIEKKRENKFGGGDSGGSTLSNKLASGT